MLCLCRASPTSPPHPRQPQQPRPPPNSTVTDVLLKLPHVLLIDSILAILKALANPSLCAPEGRKPSSGRTHVLSPGFPYMYVRNPRTGTWGPQNPHDSSGEQQITRMSFELTGEEGLTLYGRDLALPRTSNLPIIESLSLGRKRLTLT